VQHGLFASSFESLQCIAVSIESLIQGLFCAGAGMISFGALLGKASPTQVILLLFLEVPIYSFNWSISSAACLTSVARRCGCTALLHASSRVSVLLFQVFWPPHVGPEGQRAAASNAHARPTMQELCNLCDTHFWWCVQDFGGSIAIHAFGAYYGLAATWVLFRSAKGAGGEHAKNRCGYIDDLTAMIGTIFLWVYWPSFNAAIAVASESAGNSGVTTGALRMYAGVNTALSLCGATLAAFAACSAFKGKLDMVVVQNATLAGGVAVGSAATMLVGGTVLNVSPGGAVAIGAAAGALPSMPLLTRGRMSLSGCRMIRACACEA
jgi:ammonia channel protein AmtB